MDGQNGSEDADKAFGLSQDSPTSDFDICLLGSGANIATFVTFACFRVITVPRAGPTPDVACSVASVRQAGGYMYACGLHG